MAVNTVKIAISLPREDFKLINAMSKKLGISRSAFIDKTIHYWVNKRKEQYMVREYVKGYNLKPEKLSHIAELEKVESEALNPEENWE